MDQISAIKIIAKENFGKGKKFHATFMDLEKAYHNVDKEAFSNTFKIYGVEGQPLEGIKALYDEASAYMRVDGELNEFCYRCGNETRMCGVFLIFS